MIDRAAGLPVAGPMGARAAATAGPRLPLGRIGRGRRLDRSWSWSSDRCSPPATRPPTSFVTLAIGAPLIEEAAKGAVPADHDDRPPSQRAELADRLPGLRRPLGGGLRLAGEHPYIGGGESLRRVAGHRGAAADHGAVRPPAVHHDDRHRRLLRAAAAERARQGGLHPARVRRRGDHARAVERLVAARHRGVLPGLPALDGADLRAGDRARRSSSRRREQRVVAAKLPGMVAAGLVTPNEATWLGSIRTRKSAIGEATRFGGKPAAQGGQELRRAGGRAGLRPGPHRPGLRRPAGVRPANEEAYGVHAARAAAPDAAAAGRVPRARVAR